MNQKVRRNYAQLAQSAGLQLDEDGGGLYGARGGYSLAVQAPNESYPYNLAVTLSAQRPGAPLEKDECKQFRREHKSDVSGLAQQGTVITMAVRPTANQELLQQRLRNAIDALTGYLQANGFRPGCQFCGRADEVAPCFAAGTYLHLCPDCFATLQQDRALSAAAQAQRGENVVGGIVGALLGSLVGVLCIVLLSQLGYVAALSGLLMAVGTMKGYELLGGRLSKRGVIICLVIMLVMTYVGDQVDWAIVVVRDLDADFFTAFRAVPALREIGAIEAVPYWTNLIMLYAFLLLGAIPTTIHALKSQRNAARIHRPRRGDACELNPGTPPRRSPSLRCGGVRLCELYKKVLNRISGRIRTDCRECERWRDGGPGREGDADAEAGGSVPPHPELDEGGDDAGGEGGPVRQGVPGPVHRRAQLREARDVRPRAADELSGKPSNQKIAGRPDGAARSACRVPRHAVAKMQAFWRGDAGSGAHSPAGCTLVACKEYFPTYTPPENTDWNFFRRPRAAKLCRELFV